MVALWRRSFSASASSSPDRRRLSRRSLVRQSAAAAETLTRLGLASEYDALAARRALVQAESEQATANDARALAFVALYKAVGGAPLPAEDAPAARQDAPADWLQKATP